MISKHIKFLRDSAKIATLLVNNSSTNINEHGSKTKTDQMFIFYFLFELLPLSAQLPSLSTQSGSRQVIMDWISICRSNENVPPSPRGEGHIHNS